MENDEKESELTVTPQQIKAGVSAIVSACISAQLQKRPIKLSNLRRVSAVTGAGFKKVDFAHVLERAKALLEKTFAYRLLSMSADDDLFTLVSTLGVPLPRLTDHSAPPDFDREAKRKAWIRNNMLHTTLLIIFMSKQSIDGETLDRVWKQLYGCSILDKHHHYLGNVNELLMRDWQRKHYIHMEKIDRGGDVMRYHFQWGARAETAVSKGAMLKFAALVEDRVPEAFTDKFELARQQNPDIFTDLAETAEERAEAENNVDNDEIVLVGASQPQERRATRSRTTAAYSEETQRTMANVEGLVSKAARKRRRL